MIDRPTTYSFTENLGDHIRFATLQINLQFDKLCEVMRENRYYSTEVDACRVRAIDAYMAALSEVFKHALRRTVEPGVE